MREPEEPQEESVWGSSAEKIPPLQVREAQGNGIYLLAHGEPHDPCPVAGCGGTLLFLHR